jgi:hypothetical protein
MSEENKAPTDAVAEVGVTNTRWWNALLAGDVATLDSLLEDDLTFHSPYGTTDTKAGFIENLRSGRLKYDSIRDESPLIRIHGHTGIVTGRVDIQFQWEGKPIPENLYYTAVYGWTAPHWHMLAYHSTQRR